MYRIGYAVTSSASRENLLLDASIVNMRVAYSGHETLHPGVVVGIERRLGSRECERHFEYRPWGFPLIDLSEPEERKAEPVERRQLGAGDVGDRELERLVREARERDIRTEFCIDAKLDVPFQAVVDVIDVLREMGVEQIDFQAHRPR